MNASTLSRGLAALALVCLFVPRASAFPVTLLTESRHVTVRYGDPDLPLTVNSFAPAIPFAPFNAAANGGIATAWQNSTITPTSIQATGYYSANTLFPANRPFYAEPSSLFSTTFQVVEPVSYEFTSYRELGIYGKLDVALSGPGVNIFLSGATIGPNTNNYSLSGLLQPGVYSISVDQKSGIVTIPGPYYNGTNGKYSISLVLTPTNHVPDLGSSAGMLGITLVFLLLFVHRRSIRSLAGV